MAEQLFALALSMLVYCKNQDEFSSKEFARMTKEFAALYRRADFKTQGEYHHLWAQAL